MTIARPTLGALLLVVAASAAPADDPADATAPSTPSAVSSAQSADLGTILDRAGKYVAEYENVARDLVANEAYQQMYWDTARHLRVRNLRSDVIFVMLPGAIRWTLFRDVYEVDGKAVRDRRARLEKLFSESPTTALEQAQAIVREGTRYDLGPVIRTVNVPPVTLLFLHPKNQARFAFKRKGRCSIDDLAGVELSFSETTRPTLVRGEWQGDVPTQGRLCIDPASGTILRTDVEFDMDGKPAERSRWARVLVLYRRDARLDAWVPSEMKETYELTHVAPGPPTFDPATVMRAGDGIRIEATARYSDFHRLNASTHETFRAAPQPSP